MSNWHLCWVDVQHWLGERDRLGAETARLELGAALAVCFAIVPSDGTIESVGVLGDRSPTNLDGSPTLLEWTGTQLEPDDFGREAGDLAAAFDLASRPPVSEFPVLLLRIEARPAETYIPHDLGRIIFDEIDSPGSMNLQEHGLQMNTCLTLARGVSTLLVWYRLYAFALAELDPAQRYDLRDLLVGPSGAPDHEIDDEPLTLVGFQLEGARIEPKTFVALEPGGVTVLFGRNGAGKTLVLDAVSNALQALHDGVDNARAAVEGAACDVVLRARTQDAADRLFRLIFGHIGWSPLAKLDPITQLELNQLLPSWSALTERPSDAEGLSPDELVAQPLAVMRSALVDAIVATSSWGSGEHVRRLTEAILSSPLIVWCHDGSIALAVKISDLDDSLRVPAQTLLAQIPTMGDVALRPPLDMALLFVSRSLTGGEPKNVVVLNPTPVLTPETAPRMGFNISTESPWLQLGVQLWTAVRSAAPIHVRFDPSLPSDRSTSDLAEQAIIRLLARFGREQSDDGVTHPFVDDPLLVPVVRSLNARVNTLLPKFIAESGALEITVAPPGEWHKRRTRVEFVSNFSRAVPVDEAPAGFRTWGRAVLSFAEAQLLHADWAGKTALFGDFVAGPSDRRISFGSSNTSCGVAFEQAEPDTVVPILPTTSRLLFLLDEPEAHLHLSAQRDGAEIAAQLSLSGQGSLVATHSLAFVDQVTATVNVITLAEVDGKTSAEPAGGLESLTGRATELGIPPSALAQACRAVLAVEGKNDVEIIRRFGGVDLDQHFIVLTVLQGHGSAEHIAELEFIHTLRIPIVVMLDHVRRSILEEALKGRRDRLYGEERTLVALHEALATKRLAAFALPFAKIDIVCAVPDDEMRWAFGQLGDYSFDGWSTFTPRAEEAYKHRGDKFKDFFRSETGSTVEQVIGKLVAGDRRGESRVLKEALSTMIDGLGTPQRSGLVVLQR